MDEEELKKELGRIIKKYDMKDPKAISSQIKAGASKIEGDKEETILRLVEIAGKENMEVATAWSEPERPSTSWPRR